jgi:hypothetical protein
MREKSIRLQYGISHPASEMGKRDGRGQLVEDIVDFGDYEMRC